MGFRRGLREYLFDRPLFIDNERHALSHLAARVRDAQRFDEFEFGIAKQGEGELLFVDEFLLQFGIICAGAEHDRAGREVRENIAKPAGFDGSATRHRFGVEKHDDRFAFELLDLKGLGILFDFVELHGGHLDGREFIPFLHFQFGVVGGCRRDAPRQRRRSDEETSQHGVSRNGGVDE